MTSIAQRQAMRRPAVRQEEARVQLRLTPFVLLLQLLVVALFCQIWFDVGGFTVRLEDLIALLFAATLVLPLIVNGRLGYYRHPLNLPILVWMTVLAVGVAVTLASPLSRATQKDAIVNGLRLILAFGLFFAIFRHQTPARVKREAVLRATLLFSFVTTTVVVLQMGHWDGWLPFDLPSILVTFKEGANDKRGRELFALFLGSTGSHAWSGALAMQALLVYLIARHTPRRRTRAAAWAYFGLLAYILMRISVRNSILGLFVTIVALELVRRRRQVRDIASGLIRPIAIVLGIVIVLVILFSVAPDSYSVVRIRQAIPRFEDGALVFAPGSNILGRFEFWQTALKIFAHHPILGGGFYSYEELSGVYGPRSIVHAHNSFFQTLAELGLVGALAFGLLLFSVGRYLVRTRRFARIPGGDALWWELAAGSVIFLGFSMIFANTLWSPNHVAFRMIILATLASLIREVRR